MYRKTSLITNLPTRPKLAAARHLFVVVGLIVLVGLTIGRTLPVHAATITVNTTADEINNDGDCSLREAIRAANLDQAVDGCAAGDGTDTLILPAGDYVFDLAGTNEDAALNGDLDITEDLILNGADRNTTTIDANGLDRVFQISSSTLQLSGVTITGGNTPTAIGSGILLYTNGSLTLTDSRVTNNIPSGGIQAASSALSLTITNSLIDNNVSSSGGGIGFSGSSTTAIIRNSTIYDNTTTGVGGGISSQGILTLVNSTVSGNSTELSGGGISTGGGGTTNLYNVTISNNTADSNGNNSGDGGGISSVFGTTYAANTIIGGNFDDSSGVSHPDCTGEIDSLGHNLIQDTGGCTITGDTTGNQIGMSPKLDNLAENGGSTMTHALLVGSPAIDAGGVKNCPDERGTPLTTDQRGYVRPVNGNLTPDVVCDIGAFERLSRAVPTPTNTPTATASPTSSATPTVTATSTPGPSPTPTNTVTPGPSPTATETATPGPSPTATIPFVPGYWVYLPVNPDD